jgi:hypothetical protein
VAGPCASSKPRDKPSFEASGFDRISIASADDVATVISSHFPSWRLVMKIPVPSVYVVISEEVTTRLDKLVLESWVERQPRFDT